MSSGFISETEIQKQRELRQKEWERVRTVDQPLEAPEVEYDCRSLYHKLQDAKVKKQEEWEESRKLKNTIRKLDQDDCTFLELVDRTKQQHSAQISADEKRELAEFREAQISSLEGGLIDVPRDTKPARLQRSQSSSDQRNGGRGPLSKQSRLMSGAVVRRSSNSSSTSTSQPTLPTTQTSSITQPSPVTTTQQSSTSSSASSTADSSSTDRPSSTLKRQQSTSPTVTSLSTGVPFPPSNSPPNSSADTEPPSKKPRADCDIEPPAATIESNSPSKTSTALSGICCYNSSTSSDNDSDDQSECC